MSRLRLPDALGVLGALAAVGALGQPPRGAVPPALRPPADAGRHTLRRLPAAAPERWTLRQFGPCDPALATRDPARPAAFCERAPTPPPQAPPPVPRP